MITMGKYMHADCPHKPLWNILRLPAPVNILVGLLQNQAESKQSSISYLLVWSIFRFLV